MKTKTAQIFYELIVIGVGAMLTKLIETVYWIGIVVIAVGVIGLIITLARGTIKNWIPIRIVNIKYDKPVKSQIDKPEALIFPYISNIDASQLQYGKNFVTIYHCYPSALSYDITFIKVRCCLIIAGSIPTPEQEMAPLVIKKQANNKEYYVNFLLGDIDESIKGKIKNREAMEYRLQMRCWDSDNKEHRLDTELQRRMIALA